MGHFGASCGQQINRTKSRLFFSKKYPSKCSAIDQFSAWNPCTKDLGSYLGIPIITGRKGREDFSYAVDKVRRKLTGWKAKSLSQAERISLAQSCIMSIPTYVMQTAVIPVSVCDEVERICLHFIWGSTPEQRRHHLISWDSICGPKRRWGIGFLQPPVGQCYVHDETWLGINDNKGFPMGPGTAF